MSFILLNKISVATKLKIISNQESKFDIKILETNMNDIDIDKCKNVLNRTLSKKYGTRKTARAIKTELDIDFGYYQYRFSIIINSNSDYILAKKLYGLWASLTAKGKHYLLIASYTVVKGVPITEAQMDRIEDWTANYFIKYENVTNDNTRIEAVSKSLKAKLDKNYGNGNVWAVIVFKQKFNIRAKELEDTRYVIEFDRLNEGHFFIFRGGEGIPL
jgi:hypothetical protein